MTTRLRPASTPPPCAEVCWERITVRADYIAWVYVRTDQPCDHWYDGIAGVWRWGPRGDRPPDDLLPDSNLPLPGRDPDQTDDNPEHRRRDLW